MRRSVTRSHDLSRTLLALLMISLASSHTGAEEPHPPERQRVFVCAHSFMILIADLLPPMAAAAKVDYATAGTQMIGGSQVVEHWRLPDDRVKPALESGAVDVLILSPTAQLPDPGIDAFTRLGLATNPGLRVLVQASWPAYDDPGSWSIAAFERHAETFRHATRDQATIEHLERMRRGQKRGWGTLLTIQVRMLNAAIGRDVVRIVPVHEAVFALRLRIAQGTMPGLTRQTELFVDDIGHPTPPLRVLVAYCHFVAIFQRSPLGLPVPGELQPYAEAEALNLALQEIAWATIGPQ